MHWIEKEIRRNRKEKLYSMFLFCAFIVVLFICLLYMNSCSPKYIYKKASIEIIWQSGKIDTIQVLAYSFKEKGLYTIETAVYKKYEKVEWYKGYSVKYYLYRNNKCKNIKIIK